MCLRKFFSMSSSTLFVLHSRALGLYSAFYTMSRTISNLQCIWRCWQYTFHYITIFQCNYDSKIYNSTNSENKYPLPSTLPIGMHVYKHNCYSMARFSKVPIEIKIGMTCTIPRSRLLYLVFRIWMLLT